MSEIKKVLQESRNQECDSQLYALIESLREEGLDVEFGKIGIRTTYALLHNEDSSIEIVGYTFLKDMKYYKENVGKLKALQQAIARKKISEGVKGEE